MTPEAAMATYGPLLLALWASLWVGYLAYRTRIAPVSAARRASKALGQVLSSGEITAPEEAPPEPAWASPAARWGWAAAGAILGLLLFGIGPIALGLGAAGYFGPAMYRSWSRKREAARLEEDMPDLLASLAANARLTGDLAALLEGAARDLEAKGPDRPLAQRLRRAAARLRAKGAEAALAELEAESPSPALAGLAFRLRLYARLGGAFADLLEESARRQRRRLEGIARAAAKAAGATGLANMLAAMGIAAAGLLVLLDPQARAFYRSGIGQAVLAFLIGMMALGRFVIADMVEDVR